MMEHHQTFNLSLMEQINEPRDSSFTAPAEPVVNMADDGQFTQIPPDTGSGDLIVQVSIARGSIPVEGATVTVTDNAPSPNHIALLMTDNSGRTERLSLSAPSRELSQTPNGTQRPYSVYHVLIEKEGYYPVQLLNIPIFDRISSIQPVALVPLSEGTIPPGEVIINEIPETALYAKE